MRTRKEHSAALSPVKPLSLEETDLTEIRESMQNLRSLKNSVMHARMQKHLENGVPSFARRELDGRVHASYLHRARKP